jgi:hypothetical protein
MSVRENWIQPYGLAMVYPHSVNDESRVFKLFGRRSATRAAKVWPDTDTSFRVARTSRLGISIPKKQGAIEGPIKIPLDSRMFLINALELPIISMKSFRFRSALFSIPAAPANPAD